MTSALPASLETSALLGAINDFHHRRQIKGNKKLTCEALLVLFPPG